jgi:hypothetical protein
MSMSTMSVVASERAVELVGHMPAGDRTAPRWATDVSRIEMRLLRDTRRVLEYLSVRNENTGSKKSGRAWRDGVEEIKR